MYLKQPHIDKFKSFLLFSFKISKHAIRLILIALSFRTYHPPDLIGKRVYSLGEKLSHTSRILSLSPKRQTGQCHHLIRHPEHGIVIKCISDEITIFLLLLLTHPWPISDVYFLSRR